MREMGLWWRTGFGCSLLAMSVAGCKAPDATSNSVSSGTAATSTGNASSGNDATGAAQTTSAPKIGAARPYEGKDILLGEYGSMTGTTATYGKSTHNGVMMAVDEANAAGGVLGKKIRVQLEDDGSKPEQAATAVTKLINSDNVLTVIGEVASSRSLAAAPICQAAGVPMMSPASTNPKVTQVGDYIFRACYIDPVQGRIIAHLGSQDLKAKNAAILRDIKNAYSVGLADEISKEFTKNGGQIVADQSFQEGDKDFRAQLTTIKSKNPQVVFVPAYYNEVALIARQMRSLGMQQPILGGDGVESPKLIEIGGPAVNNTMFTTHFSSESTDPLARKFVQGYKQRYGVIPDGLTAVGYDAARLTIDAIKRAGSTDRAKIRQAMATTKNFPGVSGKITLNADRNAVKPMAVMKVENGKYVFVKTMNE